MIIVGNGGIKMEYRIYENGEDTGEVVGANSEHEAICIYAANIGCFNLEESIDNGESLTWLGGHYTAVAEE